MGEGGGGGAGSVKCKTRGRKKDLENAGKAAKNETRTREARSAGSS